MLVGFEIGVAVIVKCDMFFQTIAQLAADGVIKGGAVLINADVPADATAVLASARNTAKRGIIAWCDLFQWRIPILLFLMKWQQQKKVVSEKLCISFVPVGIKCD